MPEEKELISVRGLQDSEYGGTPLRKFRGILDSYNPDDRKFGTFIVLNFKDLSDVEAVEPYNFPIAQIAIKYSNKKNSAWGVFGDSLALLLPDDEDIKDTVGKRYGMEMEIGHIYGQDKEGKDMLGNPWKVFELEGAVAGEKKVTAKDEALRLLIGRTRAEFNKEAYADPIIRKDTALQRAITDKSFVNSLLQLGTVEEDENGIFRKVAPSEGQSEGG